ncbi:sugar ABC transporter substrate-binding protein [Paenibacillus hexagrammi]|uniref:Sugar ABC transporter substrate-binding protein n=1 Tax=Paenibacillus hexagrammi TaxID=2908839 RepID=A0ABY3SKE2_9BACL|nr:sugar ABC transporter substrate-binding protein [Paenibacillus sp. YPD9-1]UJF33943.1 sugar ABC transporter substrate-binding protein [Paenibacillus sp. YPD9-1]
MKKLLASVLLCITIGTGCSSTNPPPQPTATPAETDPKIDLQAWIMADSPRGDKDFMETIDPFLQSHPNISVKVKVLDWGTAWSDITKAVENGEGPDILQLGSTWVPTIASMNGIDDITSHITDVGGADAYLPASWNSTMIQGGSSVYAVPWFVDARAIYYRKDAFQAAGVNPAEAFQTWDTFKHALEKVNGVTIQGVQMNALGIPGKNDWNVPHNIFPWIWGAGGSVFAPDQKTVALNSPQALNGIMYYTGLAREGLADTASLEKNTGQIEMDFANGKDAVIVTGLWMIRNFSTPQDQGGFAGKPAAGNYAVAPLPAGPQGRATFIGGSHLSIFKQSKHKDAAWQLIKYLSSDEAQADYAKRVGMMPAKNSLIYSPELTQDPSYAAFAEATKYGHSYPAIPEWGPAETTLVKSFSNIWDIVADKDKNYTKETIQQQLDEAAKEISIIMNQ